MHRYSYERGPIRLCKIAAALSISGYEAAESRLRVRHSENISNGASEMPRRKRNEPLFTANVSSVPENS